MTADQEKRERALEICEQLKIAHQTGTLGYIQLSEAVRFVYDDGDDYNHSVGASWIWNRPADFAKAVSDRAEEFFREHRDVVNFRTMPVTHLYLFNLIAPEHRLPFLRDIVLTHCHDYYRWVAVALNAGIAKNDVTLLICDHLKQDPPMHWHVQNFVSGGVNQFPATCDHDNEHIMNRWKMFDQAHPGPWSVFNNDELEKLLYGCCEHAGKEIIKARHALIARLGEDKTDRLCAKAVEHIDDLVHLELHQLQGLPFATRWQLANRIKPEACQGNLATRFIVSVVMDYVISAGTTLLDDARPIVLALLNKIRGALTLYAVAHSLGREAPSWLEAILCDRLTHDGYVKGTVEEGTYFNTRTKKTLLQKQLRHGDILYVQDRRQHDFSPRVGEEVIVHVKSAQFRTKKGSTKILSAYFYPAKKLRP